MRRCERGPPGEPLLRGHRLTCIWRARAGNFFRARTYSSRDLQHGKSAAYFDHRIQPNAIDRAATAQELRDADDLYWAKRFASRLATPDLPRALVPGCCNCGIGRAAIRRQATYGQAFPDHTFSTQRVRRRYFVLFGGCRMVHVQNRRPTVWTIRSSRESSFLQGLLGWDLMGISCHQRNVACDLRFRGRQHQWPNDPWDDDCDLGCCLDSDFPAGRTF